MEAVDQMTPELQRLLEAKEARRRKLAAAPIREKVVAVIRLQELAAPLLQARGRNVRPWKLRAGTGH